MRYEADLVRGALLSGLVREHEVRAWAEALFESVLDDHGRIADVMCAPQELTAQREALRPLAEPAQNYQVGRALLAFMAVDAGAGSLPVADQLRVLSLLRSEGYFRSAASEDIKLFEDRLMLANVGMKGETAPTSAEVAAWLGTARQPGYYRFSSRRPDELAALLAALSRKVIRDGEWQDAPSQEWPIAWLVPRRQDWPGGLLLNEPLWRVALKEFSPLPIGSRLPYLDVPDDAELVFTPYGATAMGMDDALAHFTR